MILELDGQGPRYRQLVRALRTEILEGRLVPGEQLPATRELANELSCSRNLIVLAYDQLIVEGYATSRVRLGTFVTDVVISHRGAGRPPTAAPSLPRAARLLSEISATAQGVTRHRPRVAIDFMYGLCEPDERLVRHLKRAFSAAVKHSSAFSYGDPAGDPLLRSEVARRLQGTRGIMRSPDQVVITSGAQQGLDMCARLLLAPRDRALVEDPGYEGARAAFAAVGARVIAAPVDRDGIAPSKLRAATREGTVAYVTPSHQFPTGALLSAARRTELIQWAQLNDAWIIEDDYDGDLRHDGQPIRALAGSDGNERVIYCGTFSKALSPSFRLGYLSLPPGLVASAANAKWLLDRGSSPLLQRVVAELLANGEYDRHLTRMQRRYASRRRHLMACLTNQLGTNVEVMGAAAGLHVVAWFPRLSRAALEALVAECLRRDVGVYDLARHALKPLRRQALILGYGLLNEGDIEEGIRRIASAYHVIVRRGS